MENARLHNFSPFQHLHASSLGEEGIDDMACWKNLCFLELCLLLWRIDIVYYLRGCLNYYFTKAEEDTESSDNLCVPPQTFQRTDCPASHPSFETHCPPPSGRSSGTRPSVGCIDFPGLALSTADATVATQTRPVRCALVEAMLPGPHSTSPHCLLSQAGLRSSVGCGLADSPTRNRLLAGGQMPWCRRPTFT